MKKERDVSQREAVLWLLRRSDEHFSGNRVVLRRGGENAQPPPAWDTSCWKTFIFLHPYFFFSPCEQEREFYLSPFSLCVYGKVLL
jgi:hypothetical protein